MAFNLPDFHLNADVFDGPWSGAPPTAAPRLSITCQSTPNKVDRTFADNSLKCPSGTDVRDFYAGGLGLPDVVELPAGTGTFYEVVEVVDVAKNYPNEYRFVSMQKMWSNVPMT